MDDVQLQLPQKRIPKCAGVALCGLDTDKNFAVLKGQYVSRPRSSEKLSMQKRHTLSRPQLTRKLSIQKRNTPIENQPNRTFARLLKSVCFPFCNCKECCTALPVNFSSSAALTEIFRCKLCTVTNGHLPILRFS